jgi:uncharacterized Ntn-hydrolase superfamily protein
MVALPRHHHLAAGGSMSDPAVREAVARAFEEVLTWDTFKDESDEGLADKLIAALEASGIRLVSEDAAGLERGGLGGDVETLDAVLRGLRSERDTVQLRAIIASVEAMREIAVRRAARLAEQEGTEP